MHVHLMLNGHSDYTHWDSTYIDVFESVIMPSSAHQLLMAGVTSARDLGAPLEASINVKKRIQKGEIPGPTIYVSGPFIQKAPYPNTEAFRWGVNGAADARAKVKKLIDAGVDVIKLIDQDQMTLEEAKAVVDEAVLLLVLMMLMSLPLMSSSASTMALVFSSRVSMMCTVDGCVCIG